MSITSKQDGTYTRTASDLERKWNFGKRFSDILGLIDDSREKVDRVQSELRDEMREQSTSIMRDTTQIVMEATSVLVKQSDFDSYKESSNAVFRVMSDSITANTNKTTELTSRTDASFALLAAHQDLLNDAGVDIDAVERLVVEQGATLSVLPGEISSQVSENYVAKTEFGTYRGEVESEFEQQADSFNMSIEGTRSYIGEVDGELQSISEKINKHFLFTEDGLTIKAGESEMQLVLDNDIIYFMKNGQQFGMWDGVDFFTGNIVVELNKRAQFGNFAFIPRSSGNLSFLKVGG